MFRRPDDDDDDFIAEEHASPATEPAASTATRETSNNDEEEDLGEVSQDALNKIAAQIMKAELKGATSKVEKLKTKLEKLRGALKRAEAVNAKQIKPSLSNRRPRRQGEDTAEYTKLKNKFTSSSDASASKRRRGRDEPDSSVGSNFLDDLMEPDQTPLQKRYKEVNKLDAIMSKERGRNASSSSCRTCASTKERSRVAFDSGNVTVLITKRTVFDGKHFTIVPKDHAESTVALDEDVYQDLKAIKDKLVEVYHNVNKSLLFFEVFGTEDHLRLHCVPVNSDLVRILKGTIANTFELEQGAGKDVVFKDLSTVSGGLRRFLRPGVNYTWYGFDSEPGFVYRLSDPSEFDSDFYLSTIGSELDEDFDVLQLRGQLDPQTVRRNCEELQKLLGDVTDEA